MSGLTMSLRTFALPLLLVSAAALTSCSTVTKTESMVPEAVTVEINRNPENVALLVSGEARGITVENFKEALGNAIVENQLFGGIGDDAVYLLEVAIQKVTQPAFGAGFTVTLQSTWKVFRLADRELLWSDTVNSTYGGGAFEGGFVGANRLRVATEGAARENIRQGIGKLGQVELTGS